MSVTHAVSLYVHDTIMKKCDKAISESSSVVEGKLVQQKLEKKLLSLLEYSNREARRIFKSFCEYSSATLEKIGHMMAHIGRACLLSYSFYLFVRCAPV